MDKEKLVGMLEEYKAEHGNYPKLPCRIKYTWNGQKCEGVVDNNGLGGLSVYGFPGMLPVLDEDLEVTKLIY